MIYRLHREGGRYLIFALLFFLAAATALVAYFSIWTMLLAALAFTLLTLFLIFFRNPPRAHGVLDPEAVIAPADGKVVVIEETFEKEFLNRPALQVSIFMSPLNVHANRSPVNGEVVYQQYHEGKYLVAWHPKSSELNERNTIVIRHKSHDVLLRQIAGTVARKIVSYTRPGALLQRGEEFGFIKFGSRVDVFLPVDAHMMVKIGDTVRGGETVIAHFAE